MRFIDGNLFSTKTFSNSLATMHVNCDGAIIHRGMLSPLEFLEKMDQVSGIFKVEQVERTLDGGNNN